MTKIFKYKFFLLLVFYFVGSTECLAQKDTVQINQLLKKIYVVGYDYPDSAIIFSNEVLDLSHSNNYPLGVANAYYYLSDAYLTLGEFQIAFTYIDSTVTICNENDFKEVLGKSLNIKGRFFSDLGNYDKSIEHYEEAKEIGIEYGFNRVVQVSEANLGVSYFYKGDFPKALELFSSKVEFFKRNNDTVSYAIAVGNLSSVYTNLGKYDDALELLDVCIEYLENGYKSSVAQLLTQKAMVYTELDEFDKAGEIYHEVLKITKESGDVRRIAKLYNNIAALYFEMGQIDFAIQMSKESILISESLGYDHDIAYYNKSIAIFLAGVKRYKEALPFCLKSVELSEKLKTYNVLRDGYLLLAEIYAGLNDFENAYLSELKYDKMKDTIYNEKSRQETSELLILHEVDKQELENEKLKEENEKKDAEVKLKEAQHEKDVFQKKYMYVSIGALFIVILIVVKAYGNKKKANQEISQQKEEVESQKEIVEEQHKEIKDSMEYAKRIQAAILPSDRLVKEYFDDSFILYKPKDIVAGDFYWMEVVDGEILFAAADCTGHGVPGAMVSVVCHNALNRSVREYGKIAPASILDKATDLVIEQFEKSDEDVKDGMDIALCSLKGNVLQFSGANNPLWIVRNGEIVEKKGTKQPVGKFDNRKAFENHKLNLEAGDTIYIFSDGFVDQFGGNKGKKFKSKAFKQLLLSVQDKSMSQQKSEIDKVFESWRGDLEQIDDVCIIGVRI